MFHWFYKAFPINTFYVLLMKILQLKKARNIYTRMLEFTFWGWEGTEGGCNKKG